MWSKKHVTRVRGISADAIWKVWADINHWHTWQPDLEYARLEGDFVAGNGFLLKPKGGPKVKIQLLHVEPLKFFTDLTRFPGAKMFGHHEFNVHGDELEILTEMSIRGPLAFLWRKIVAEGVAGGMGRQTEALIIQARAHAQA